MAIGEASYLERIFRILVNEDMGTWEESVGVDDDCIAFGEAHHIDTVWEDTANEEIISILVPFKFSLSVHLHYPLCWLFLLSLRKMGEMGASEVHSRPVQKANEVLGTVAEDGPEVLGDFEEVLHPIMFGVLYYLLDIFEVDLVGVQCLLDELFMIIGGVGGEVCELAGV